MREESGYSPLRGGDGGGYQERVRDFDFGEWQVNASTEPNPSFFHLH